MRFSAVAPVRARKLAGAEALPVRLHSRRFSMLRLLLTPARRPSRHTVCIDCQVVRERDFRLVADRVENLSATGLLAGPADPVLTGERLIVSFRLPRSGTPKISPGELC